VSYFRIKTKGRSQGVGLLVGGGGGFTQCWKPLLFSAKKNSKKGGIAKSHRNGQGTWGGGEKGQRDRAVSQSREARGSRSSSQITQFEWGEKKTLKKPCLSAEGERFRAEATWGLLVAKGLKGYGERRLPYAAYVQHRFPGGVQTA